MPVVGGDTNNGERNVVPSSSLAITDKQIDNLPPPLLVAHQRQAMQFILNNKLHQKNKGNFLMFAK